MDIDSEEESETELEPMAVDGQNTDTDEYTEDTENETDDGQLRADAKHTRSDANRRHQNADRTSQDTHPTRSTPLKWPWTIGLTAAGERIMAYRTHGKGHRCIVETAKGNPTFTIKSGAECGLLEVQQYTFRWNLQLPVESGQACYEQGVICNTQDPMQSHGTIVRCQHCWTVHLLENCAHLSAGVCRSEDAYGGCFPPCAKLRGCAI
jgi:hypothetical protein